MELMAEQVQSNAARVMQIKRWFIEEFGLPEHVTVLASEISGSLTRLIVVDLPLPPREYKISKSIAAVTRQDITLLGAR